MVVIEQLRPLMNRARHQRMPSTALPEYFPTFPECVTKRPSTEMPSTLQSYVGIDGRAVTGHDGSNEEEPHD